LSVNTHSQLTIARALNRSHGIVTRHYHGNFGNSNSGSNNRSYMSTSSTSLQLPSSSSSHSSSNVRTVLARLSGALVLEDHLSGELVLEGRLVAGDMWE
jgi:hypothetical protein